MSQLLPEHTPEWLKPALGVDPSQVQELIGNRQASSLNGTNAQVPVKREAAVLMLLSGESAEEASILLTHRSPSMRSHSGQIAFPGGRRDPADTSLVDTALREAWEETDLQRNSVTPLEQWEQLHIRATGNPVSPILAHWAQPGGRSIPPAPMKPMTCFSCLSGSWSIRATASWWALESGKDQHFTPMATSFGALPPACSRHYCSTPGGAFHGITIQSWTCVTPSQTPAIMRRCPNRWYRGMHTS